MRLTSVLSLLALGDHPEPLPAPGRTGTIRHASRAGGEVALRPAQLEGRDGEELEISYWVDQPTKDDWVGLWKADEDIDKVSPFKLQMLEKDPAYLVNGTGRLNFSVVNLRGDLKAFLFRGGLKDPEHFGATAVVSVANKQLPTQRRVALGKEGWSVAWSAGSHTQHLLYRVGAGEWRQVPAARHSYSAKDMCGAPATAEGWRWAGDIHEAVIPYLDTPVTYKVGSEHAGWTEEATIQPRPTPESTVSILAFGDLGQADADDSMESTFGGSFPTGELPSLNTTRGLKKELMDGPQVVIHNGDLAYALGYASIWDQFFAQVEPVASRVPWMVTVGNHERDWEGSGSSVGTKDSGGECGVPSQTKFRMPWDTARQPNDRPWYSFDFGPVHFLMMSTEHPLNGTQGVFMEHDLSSVDRSKTPWVVAVGHRPMYIDSGFNPDDRSHDSDYGFAAYYQGQVEAIFLKHGVDAVLGAHHHSYQRSCKLKAGKCSEDGFYVINLGMGGASNSELSKSPAPIWDFLDGTHHGYVRMTASRQRLAMEYIRGSQPDKVADKLELTSGVVVVPTMEWV
mmetsp:Transcript_35730/g.75820  ORF Transcript_35730/g.75820 Transcript_35730/m.75820 type:complete len:567 (-) Transcript_35730:75-1775(-)